MKYSLKHDEVTSDFSNANGNKKAHENQAYDETGNLFTYYI